MPKLHFGHCLGCDQPIRPPYLSFKVMQVHGDGEGIAEWEDVDVCNDCAGKLTAEDLHGLVTLPDEEPADADA